MVERALRQRKRKPMFMVDLSVPRNIEPEVSALEDVYLYCIDDLQNRVEENRRFRRDSAESAEGMIRIAAERFMDWLRAQDAFRTLCVFREKFEQIRDQITQDNLRRLQLGEKPEIALKRLAHDLTNRFLHEPTRRLREAGLEREETVLNLIKELFELSHETLYTE
jgi:glutamyl-tRNA reductase